MPEGSLFCLAILLTFTLQLMFMKNDKPYNPTVKDGDQCKVIGGTHKGKSGTIRDINTSKTGNVTITVVQTNGDRFKTLARNVEVQ